ncbi:diflavin flavoprotein [Anthocerotibacter panamensis]|uniref:diflavin flavoprotein n=1 Tax=Anthocerotibacter panamensis TaxID=2857077 RepID=UPI001C403076|nr:diflavin flavoprotein [Anthocerotibacter panamensis]
MTLLTTQPGQQSIQVAGIAPNALALRAQDWSQTKFDLEYSRGHGTTYNSYLILGEKNVLIDLPADPQPEEETASPHQQQYLQELITVLQRQLGMVPNLQNPSQQLDYIVLTHVEPDYLTSLQLLLSHYPQARIVCSKMGAKFLGDLCDTPLPIDIVEGGDTMELGGGETVLHFIMAPNARWLDHMFVYQPIRKILYSGKIVSTHYCSYSIFDDDLDLIHDDIAHYYDCALAPHARQILSALKRIEPLEIKIYAPSHGPLFRYHRREVLNAYHRWSEKQLELSEQVVLIYASAYGSTTALAQAIARGLTKSGVAVEMLDVEQVDPTAVQKAIEQAAGFIIGSPTISGHAPTPIQTALGVILATAQKTQLCGVFGSFGWSGEAIDLIEGKLRDAGFSFGFPTIRVKFKPTEATLQQGEEAGTDFAQAIRKARQPRRTRSRATRTEQALGRLVGGIYVVTARRGAVQGAMVASWVSQATFSPPGLTVAVAKDRAIESLLRRGDTFVLNVLEEGKQLPLMRHFLQPFAPGEDRFAGVGIRDAENGAPILTDAMAYLECRVESRMDCNDHWLVYCLCETGKVLQPAGKTAVHHRKSGTFY